MAGSRNRGFVSPMHLQHTRAIVRLSWPILVAQLAILASGVADTVMTGHYGATHLAAIGIGAGIWITVFITLMGVLLGLSPLIARHFGADELEAIGEQVRQGLCLALALSALGVALLSFPRPLLELMQVPPEVAAIAMRYLCVIAWGLPAALLVRVFYGLTPAVGRPRPVMMINLIALFIKIPLSYALLRGLYGLPELGGVGCAVGSVAMFWTMLLLAFLFVLFDPFYRRFHILRGSFRPYWPVLKRILGVGVPIGVAHFVEVTSFTFMTLFLARLGAQVSAAHQVIANLAVVLFMVPLSLGIGTSVLIGQSLGRGDPHHAREVTLAGLRLASGIALVLVSLLLLLSRRVLDLYTNDRVVLELTLSLLPLLALFHIFDAVQGLAVNALRGYQQTLVPTLIYVACLWGIGLAGGRQLTFDGLHWPSVGLNLPPQGVAGMWAAAVASLVLAGSGVLAYLLQVSRWKAQL